MADIRSVPGAAAGLPTPTRPLQGARAEAIRAAQKAFFDRALDPSQATAPARPATAASATPVPPVTRLTFDADAPPPSRPLRPGSLLDIKV